MTTNRLTPYLDPPRHLAPTSTTLGGDMRSIFRQAVWFFGAGLLIGAFFAGMMLPIVAGVWLVFYRE